MDKLAELEKIANAVNSGKGVTLDDDGGVIVQENPKTETAVSKTETESDADGWEFTEPELLPGWVFKPWKQKLLMDIYESGVLDHQRDWGSRFRRNYDTVKAVLDSGGFEPGVTIEQVDIMDWQDVEKLYTAIWINYYNHVLVKKN
jgi:hypothetical protein